MPYPLGMAQTAQVSPGSKKGYKKLGSSLCGFMIRSAHKYPQHCWITHSLDALNLADNHRLLEGMLSLSDLVNKRLKSEASVPSQKFVTYIVGSRISIE